MVNPDSGRDDNTSERNASLEIDKMQGTQYPPNGIDFNGRQYSLQGIYADAGVSLSIQTDESDIPDLAGPDSKYDLAELHSLMTSYRNSTPSGIGNDMSAYLVVVTNYNDDGVLGIMFDSTTRLGTAVFYGNRMIREDPKAFLRTSAHELGHQFNLHHEDGTSFTEEGITKYTIMNQTRIIQGSTEGWPNAIGFKFGENEKIHLSRHTIANVQPGGGRFYQCDEEHASWHEGIG
jgi:hypothetical protein